MDIFLPSSIFFICFWTWLSIRKENRLLKWICGILALVSIALIPSQRTIQEINPSVLSPLSRIRQEKSGNILIDTSYDIESIEYVNVINPWTGQASSLPPDNYQPLSNRIIKINSILTDDPGFNDMFAQHGCIVAYKTKLPLIHPVYLGTIATGRKIINHSSPEKPSEAALDFFGVVN